jgi:hypothetical protein
MQWTKQLNAPLEEVDPEVADIIELEKARQWKVSVVQSFFSFSGRISNLPPLQCWIMYRSACQSDIELVRPV